MKIKKQFIRYPENYKYPKGLEWLKNIIKYVPARIRQGNGPYEVVHIPMFDRPVVFCSVRTKKEYAVVPIAPRYAVDKVGNVYDLITNTKLKTSDCSGYNCVIITTQTHSHYRTTVHRLMAYAWLPNNDFVTDYIVDHKNNNKKDNRLENIHWTTMEQNSANVHTRTNLKLGMYVLTNVLDKRIWFCSNLNRVSKILGLSKSTISDKKTPSWFSKTSDSETEPDELYYLADDNSYRQYLMDPSLIDLPWGIIVRNKESGELEFYNNKTKLWRKLTGEKGYLYKDSMLLDVLKDHERYELFKLHKKQSKEPVKVKNLVTGEVKEFNGIKPAKKFLKISGAKLAKFLNDDKCYRINDWVLWKNGKWCMDNLVNYSRSTSILVEFKDGTKKEFKGIRETARHFNVSQKTIINCIKDKNVPIIDSLGIKRVVKV